MPFGASPKKPKKGVDAAFESKLTIGVGLGCALIGAPYFLYGALRNARNGAALAWEGRKTLATDAWGTTRTTGRGGSLNVTFQVGGKSYDIHETIGSDRVEALKEGRPIEVIYLPGDPSVATTDLPALQGRGDPWPLAIAFAATGLGVAAWGGYRLRRPAKLLS